MSEQPSILELSTTCGLRSVQKQSSWPRKKTGFQFSLVSCGSL